jgi:hypothetical protein
MLADGPEFYFSHFVTNYESNYSRERLKRITVNLQPQNAPIQAKRGPKESLPVEDPLSQAVSQMPNLTDMDKELEDALEYGASKMGIARLISGGANANAINKVLLLCGVHCASIVNCVGGAFGCTGTRAFLPCYLTPPVNPLRRE